MVWGGQFKLYLITDRKLAGDRLIPICEEALAAAPPGSLAIQLREKDLPARELFELALQLKERCAKYGAALVINDRIDVALAAEADGVHLATNSIDATDARQLLGPSKMIGVSTHNLAEVVAAARAGADFVVFGPVCEPLSKGSYGAPRGVAALAEAAKVSSVPVLALGGITVERARELSGSGAAGVAAIGSVMGSTHPAAAVTDLLDAISGWR